MADLEEEDGAGGSARFRALVQLREKQGRHAEAAALLQTALQRLTAAFGPVHPNVASAQLHLAELLVAQGPSKAVRCSP